MKFALVNSEYERELFSPEMGPADATKSLLLRKCWQYIFYFINQDPNLGLRIHHRPSSQFCDYLGNLGVRLPTFSESAEAFNWYGKLEDRDFERKLNSKIYSYEFLLARGELPRDLHFVDCIQEVSAIILKGSHKKWILKSPFMCGGSGITLIEKIEDLPAQLDHRHILEPYLDRKLDFAVHYDHQTQEIHPYVSLIQPNGGYRGGRVYTNQQDLYADLKQDQFYPAFERALQKITGYLSELKKLPLKQNLTIDGFLYQDDQGQICDYPMCEINYRVSMGDFNKSLKRFVPENGVGEFIVFPSQNVTDWMNISPYSTKEKTGIIMVNDADTKNAYVLLCARNRQMIKRMNLLLLQDIA